MKLKTKELTTCALFAALIAVGAFIKIDIPLPMYTMHFTLQWFFVLMAGFLLGAKRSIFMRFTPYHLHLYSSMVRNIPKDASTTDRAR